MEEERVFELLLAFDVEVSFGSRWTVCGCDEANNLGLCSLLSVFCCLGFAGTAGFVATGGDELPGGMLKESFASPLDSFSRLPDRLIPNESLAANDGLAFVTDGGGVEV